ncbi:MAG: metalloregulator ArsR/SmtB family transcription factor [Clostridium sp.]|uniref:metalloregulator ArsR/SmtB family transcription factor n=1 Tax=Clostridium TaxID=1485 RepID=UPI0035B548EF
MIEEIKVFKALSDETRVKILLLISKKSMCAKGIAREVKLTESAVSQHIKVLKESNLIVGYKIGYHIIYDLNIDVLEKASNMIRSIVNLDKKHKKESVSKLCISDCKHIKCLNNKIEEEIIVRVCFPVKENEGMSSMPYGHFGTAPLFVICDLEKKEVRTINNGDLGHEHGKCQPMKALGGEDIDAVIVGGIGAGAITKLNSMGIKVYKAVSGDIESNIKALELNELQEFSSTHTCSHNCTH